MEAGKKYRHTLYKHEVICLFVDKKGALFEYTKMVGTTAVGVGHRFICSTPANFSYYEEYREPTKVFVLRNSKTGVVFHETAPLRGNIELIRKHLDNPDQWEIIPMVEMT